MLNAAYGTFIALALWLIGVPSPALWGILAGLMRFVPFVGSIIAGAMPVMLAAAVYPGWSPALLTLALFVASEAVMGQVMEPWLLGRATGLSPLAAIVCVSFWAWLWGPVGLVLAIPMTVCLIVLGRHVEQMSFLYVLLGDEPALTPAQGFYQRLLTGDTAEIIHQTYMDTVALPGLLLAQEDVRRGRFTTERLREMEEAIEEVIDEFDELEPPDGQGKAPEQEQDDGKGSEPPPLPVLDPDRLRPEWRTPAPVLCIGVRNPLDRAAARILALLASKHGLSCRVVGPEAVGPAAIAALDLKDTQMAVLSYLDAMAGPAYAKYLLRRLRRRKPKLGVILGFWGESRYSTPEFAADVDGEARQAGTFREALVALLDAAAKRDEAQSPPRPTPIQADGPRSAPTPVERPEPAT